MDRPGKKAGAGSHSLLQGIFPTQGSNLGLPHCRQIFYYLSHQGSPGERGQANSMQGEATTRQWVQPNAAVWGDFVEEVLPIPGLQGELFLASGNTSSADASVPRSPGVLAPGGSSFPSIHTPRAMLTSVATEDLLVHNGSDGQAVEAISEGLPQFDVVASLACPGRRRQLTRGPLCPTLSPGLQAFQGTCVLFRHS